MLGRVLIEQGELHLGGQRPGIELADQGGLVGAEGRVVSRGQCQRIGYEQTVQSI